MDKINKMFEPRELRSKVLRMAYAGSSVHIGCAFSIIEILAVLYKKHLKYPENNPDSKDRDYLILSKGHGVMAQYACMHELGWIKEREIDEYFSDGSELKGLSDSRTKGLEVTSGSLGHGFSIGVGIALGLKKSKREQKVYAIVGDGELNEGTIWEGMMFATQNKLDNLIMIVDMNGYQAMGKTEDIMTLGDIRKRTESFGFKTVSVDGHNERSIDTGIQKLWNSGEGQPKALIAKTIKGKGVPFMENDNAWHYNRLDAKTYIEAIQAIKPEEKIT